MKSAIASITLALLVTPAWAYHQNSTPDLQQSITNVHDSHFPHVAGDSHEPERGSGDSTARFCSTCRRAKRTCRTRRATATPRRKAAAIPTGSVLND